MTKPIAKSDGAWTFKKRLINELAARIKPGDLLYVEDCSASVPASRKYDARKGEAPGFDVLVAALAERGLMLVGDGPYYWRAVARSKPTTTTQQPERRP